MKENEENKQKNRIKKAYHYRIW